jgi:tRNA(Ile2) C34 agmatinyltransferase TiaS
MNQTKSEKPVCAKCKTAMSLISTGSLVRTFQCTECREIKIVKREDDRKEVVHEEGD